MPATSQPRCSDCSQTQTRRNPHGQIEWRCRHDRLAQWKRLYRDGNERQLTPTCVAASCADGSSRWTGESPQAPAPQAALVTEEGGPW